MEILDLLNEESFSGASSSRASLYIRREVLLRKFEKVSQSLKYDSKFFLVHKHINIYMDTNPDHFTPLELRVRGKDAKAILKHCNIFIA